MPGASRSERDDAADRLRAALQLQAFGKAMKLRQLRRAHPEETEEELRRRLLDWALRTDEPDFGPHLRLRPPRYVRPARRDAPPAR